MHQSKGYRILDGESLQQRHLNRGLSEAWKERAREDILEALELRLQS